MKKKGLVVAALVSIMSLSSVICSFAGEWKQDDKGWWWQEDDGTFPWGKWKQINGKWYYFNEAGYMAHNVWIVDYAEGSDTYDYYYVTESGEMIADKALDGGYLDSSGALHMDELEIENGKLMYYGRDGKYESTIGWKSQMLVNWHNRLSDYKVYGSFSMDYQLPANWAEEYPIPLMTADINNVCFNKWGGTGIVNWDDSWTVDENNVIHIKASYWEYKG